MPQSATGNSNVMRAISKGLERRAKAEIREILRDQMLHLVE